MVSSFGAHVGYIRVSSAGQHMDRQLADVPLHKTFEDTGSGRHRKRPGLEACLAYLREGDTLHVHSIDRLARNLLHLQELVEQLTARGITIVFHKEDMVFEPDAKDPMRKLLLQFLGAFAEFERTLIRERQREGIAAARAKGKRFGRPPSIPQDIVDAARAEVALGVPLTTIARKYAVARTSLYSRLYG